MSFLGFGGPSVNVSFTLSPNEKRTYLENKLPDGSKKRVPIYYDGEDVAGSVHLTLKKAGSRLEHQGVRIEFLGQIEILNDRGNTYEFVALSKLLAYPGEINDKASFDFNFQSVEKPYESYTGTNIRLRYLLRLIIIKRFTNIVADEEIYVQTLSQYSDESIKKILMEVGIEDCLHIEFEYNKSKYHLRDVIIGKIYFSLVRIKIKHMEIAVMRREIMGTGSNAFIDNEIISRYEILDGAPSRGESIPIRLFLAAYDLTPTMPDIQNKFSVRYLLNLILVDEDERRYFKQQEIILWRKPENDFLQCKEKVHAVTDFTYNQEDDSKNEKHSSDV